MRPGRAPLLELFLAFAALGALVVLLAGAGPADEEADALLARLSARLADAPFAAAADLTITRPGRAERTMLLRISHAPPDRWLLAVDGRVREKGMRLLLTDGRAHVWFPKAELVLELPTGDGGERLLGSDFALGDLLVLAEARERFDATVTGRGAEEGVRLVTLALRPRASGAADDGSHVRLTLVEQNAAPWELAFVDGDGAVVRRLRFEGSGPLPDRWTADDPRRPGARSSLQVRSFDPAPRFHDAVFTVEGLRR